MKKTSLAWAACLVFSLVSGMPVHAQATYPPVPTAPPVYTQQQLDQMLAPVALYPDSLLAQVLMASTYPLEVVQAQRFVEARPGLQGDGLARAVAPMPWDPSVKALVQFPSVLAMLNDRLDWTQQMGQAFLGQQATVMDTVQNLRERARIAGTLESSSQQRVLVQDEMIEIVPVNPQVVYVPYYNPVLAYGDWWWPSAPPVVWAPPPRYRPPSYTPGFTAGISFGTGIGVMTAVFGDARPDWRQRQMMVSQTRINNVTNTNVTNVTNVNNTRVVNNVTINQRPVVWHHDARYGGGGRYARQPAPTLSPPAGPVAAAPSGREQAMPGGTPRPQPVADNVQQRLAQQDQLRQRQAVEQQHQREQQANDQQRQREQMIRQQQDQRDQQAREQRQQQQAQERQWQQRQQETQQQLQHQQQMQQRQLQQQQREQQMRQQQMQNQQHEQQRQMEQAREQARQHQEQAQRQQVQQQARQQQQREQQRDQHPRREERRDERS